MTGSNTSTFLRRVLLADAAMSGLSGVTLVLGAPVLEPAFALPRALLIVVGLGLLPFSAFLVAIARRPLSPAAVRTVVAANAAWVVASVLLLASGWIQPTALGYAFVVVQAMAVAVVGGLEYFGLRRVWTVAEGTSA